MYGNFKKRGKFLWKIEMDQKRFDREKEMVSQADSAPVIEARMLLIAFLREQVAAHLLGEEDERILALRLGLEDGHCHTLDETADLIHKSPEVVRRHQYLTLRRAIRNLRFFKLFRDYARLVPLPKGVTYYLNKYSDYTDTF
jgi:DNA-directed RNA polymerase sigma subunit (sigma70/sigma32)